MIATENRDSKMKLNNRGFQPRFQGVSVPSHRWRAPYDDKMFSSIIKPSWQVLILVSGKCSWHVLYNLEKLFERGKVWNKTGWELLLLGNVTKIAHPLPPLLISYMYSDVMRFCRVRQQMSDSDFSEKAQGRCHFRSKKIIADFCIINRNFVQNY